MDIFQVIIYILIALFGLSVGSFLNVVILRFDDIKSIVNTRSHCPKCKKEIPWYDLVPFFSYIILNGKCRLCRKTISIQYPLVEAATAITFALIYWQYNISWESLFLVLILSLLIIIAAYDWLHSEIPDILTYLAALLALGFAKIVFWRAGNIFDLDSWLSLVYGLLIGGGFLGLLVLVSRQKWMGSGDALLGAFMGLFLGYPNILLALFLSFLLGTVVSIFLLIFKHKTLKSAIPFGPFLVMATFITFFFGEQIMAWYWRIYF